MTQYWEPGTQYNYDDVVEYEGSRYKIIQPHRSQSDWTPSVTPALWGKLQGGHNQQQNQGNNQQQQQYQPPPPQQQQQQQQYGDDKHNQGQNSEEKPEGKQHWYDLDAESKKKLAVGGGLAAGAALLAGGLFAYKEHKENKEERGAAAWAQENWISEATARTQLFRQHGPSGPATWILTQGKNIPQGAIAVGQEKSWTLYIARAYLDGGIQVGKASDVFKKGSVLGYKNDEIHVETYEVLVGDMSGLRWVPASGRLNVAALGHRPVEGGRENDGTPLYIAQAPHDGAVHPGKASEKLDGAYIPYGGKEKNIREYRVLCYNN